jgi:hypothetical protein
MMIREGTVIVMIKIAMMMMIKIMSPTPGAQTMTGHQVMIKDHQATVRKINTPIVKYRYVYDNDTLMTYNL